MHRRILRPLIFLGVLSLLLSGCGGTGQSDPTPAPEDAKVAVEATMEAVAEDVASGLSLAMTAWTLERMGSPEAGVAVLEGTRPTLNYFLDYYAGSGGCNWYLATYVVDGDQIDMRVPSQTRLACTEPEGVLDQESTFIGALPNATHFVIEADRLHLFTVGDQALATLVPAETVEFEGTDWALRLFADGEEWYPLLEGGTITALFDGGEVSGSSGCNTYRGSYELDGEDITIGPLAVTEMACDEPSGVMEQESGYLETLQSAASYRVVGGMMVIFDTTGAATFQFGAQ